MAKKTFLVSSFLRGKRLSSVQFKGDSKNIAFKKGVKILKNLNAPRGSQFSLSEIRNRQEIRLSI